MPSQASTLTVIDGKDTPLSHVFTSAGAVSNSSGEIVATWLNRLASVLTAGAERFIIYFKQKADGAVSVREATIMPITETVAGVLKVTKVLKATTTYELPANSTDEESRDLRLLHMRLGETGANDQVVDKRFPVT